MSQSKTSSHTRILAEIVVFSALAAVLYTVRPFSLPFGGAVTLGSMVPVMFLSLRRGIRVGVIAGAVFGALALPIDVVTLGASNIIVTPQQVFLEYPLAFGLIGLTGMFHSKTVRLAILGAGISVLLRFWVHYFVGVYVWYYVYTFPTNWGPIASGRYVWPAIYNGSFLLVEFIVSAVLLAVLVRRGTLDYAS